MGALRSAPWAVRVPKTRCIGTSYCGTHAQLTALAAMRLRSDLLLREDALTVLSTRHGYPRGRTHALSCEESLSSVPNGNSRSSVIHTQIDTLHLDVVVRHASASTDEYV